MRSFLGLWGEANVSDQPRVWAYRETVFNQRYGKDAVGLRTSREMRTIAEAVDALVEGDVLRAGDLLIQRFKALETAGSTSRAYSKKKCRACLLGSATQAGSSLEERRVSRHVKALRIIPPDQEGRRKKQKLGVHSVKRKEWRQSAAVQRQLKSTEDGVKAVRTPQKDDVPGGRGLRQLRPSCLKCSGFTTATSKGLRRRSLGEYFGNARDACCCGASVAPWRFGLGGAAHVLHVEQSLEQFRAAVRPLAVASSLELGVIRRVLEAVRRRAEASQQPSGATPSA